RPAPTRLAQGTSPARGFRAHELAVPHLFPTRAARAARPRAVDDPDSLWSAVLRVWPKGRGARLNLRVPPPVRFVLVGAANTLTGLLAIYAMKFVLGFHDVLANLLGYAAGMSLSYWLNARWTFS